jgi:hypothetical protein
MGHFTPWNWIPQRRRETIKWAMDKFNSFLLELVFFVFGIMFPLGTGIIPSWKSLKILFIVGK